MKWTVRQYYHVLVKNLVSPGSDARLKIESHKIPIRVAASMAVLIMCLPSSVNAATYVINMKFNEDTGQVYFEPQQLKISLGDEITWVQRDGDNGHNVISYPNRIPAGTETFKSPMLKRPGTHWSKVFDKIGTYEYHCHPHEAAGMRGIIVVERESLPHEFRKAKSKEHDHSPETSQVVQRESLPHELERRDPRGPTIHPRLPR